MDISVVLGTYNRKSFLKIAINTIRKELSHLNLNHEIIIIDGGSSDGTLKWLSKQKDLITIIQHNRGSWNGKIIEHKSWGYFMNLGFKCAKGKYICMLSDDCLVIPGAIANGLNLFESKLKSGLNIGALAFYFRDWPINERYNVHSEFGKIYVNHGLYLREALQKVDYIDEEFRFYNADIDLCLKLFQNGFLTEASPDSYIEHFRFANPKLRNLNNQSRTMDNNRIIEKWQGILFNSIDEIKDLPRYYYKDFTDATKTYKNFKKPIIMKDIYFSGFLSLINKITGKNNNTAI